MAEHHIDISKLPGDVRDKLAELDLELSEVMPFRSKWKEEQCTEIASLLLSLGAKVDEADAEGQTPLFFAAMQGSVAMIELLVKAGANPNAESHYGSRPLAVAVLNLRTEAARRLVELGGQLTSTDVTSLAGGQWLEILREVGADLGVTDAEGWTGLHWAVNEDQVEAAQNLLDWGLGVDCLTSHGWSPLHMAAASGRLEAARLLVARGAELNRRDQAGRTPLTLALAEECRHVAVFLKSKGGIP